MLLGWRLWNEWRCGHLIGAPGKRTGDIVDSKEVMTPHDGVMKGLKELPCLLTADKKLPCLLSHGVEKAALEAVLLFDSESPPFATIATIYCCHQVQSNLRE
jgi:hypothetical protein